MCVLTWTMRTNIPAFEDILAPVRSCCIRDSAVWLCQPDDRNQCEDLCWLMSDRWFGWPDSSSHDPDFVIHSGVTLECLQTCHTPLRGQSSEPSVVSAECRQVKVSPCVSPPPPSPCLPPLRRHNVLLL